jgi:hypothetical protein
MEQIIARLFTDAPLLFVSMLIVIEPLHVLTLLNKVVLELRDLRERLEGLTLGPAENAEPFTDSSKNRLAVKSLGLALAFCCLLHIVAGD